jgi:hypothetical protein
LLTRLYGFSVFIPGVRGGGLTAAMARCGFGQIRHPGIRRM